MLTYEIPTYVDPWSSYLQSAVARVFTTRFTGIRTHLMELRQVIIACARSLLLITAQLEYFKLTTSSTSGQDTYTFQARYVQKHVIFDVENPRYDYTPCTRIKPINDWFFWKS